MQESHKTANHFHSPLPKIAAFWHKYASCAFEISKKFNYQCLTAWLMFEIPSNIFAQLAAILAMVLMVWIKLSKALTIIHSCVASVHLNYCAAVPQRLFLVRVDVFKWAQDTWNTRLPSSKAGEDINNELASFSLCSTLAISWRNELLQLCAKEIAHKWNQK